MTADKYDADVTNDADNATAHAASIGGYDVLRLDLHSDLPGGLSDLVQLGSLATTAAGGAWEKSDLVDIAAAVGDLGLNAVVYAMDPLNFLINAGLTFLVDVVQPLQDLVGLVSGNSERMTAETAKWVRVGDALGPLAQEIRDAADSDLIGWTGAAADAAKARLHEFADGVASLSNDVLHLKTVLDIAAGIASAAESIIVSIIATFVEWLVLTWVPALTAAAPTLGASTAAAGAATTAEAAVATSRAALFIQRVIGLLQRLRAVLEHAQPALMERVAGNFRMLSGFDGVRTSTVTAAEALKGIPADLMGTWARPGFSLGVAADADAATEARSPAPRLSDDEQRRALDPEREP